MNGTRLVTPVLLYREPEFAAQWLIQAFGAQRETIARSASGDIDYISLHIGQSRVLICPRPIPPFDGGTTRRAQHGSASTQMCYLVVDELERHFQRARAHGAGIVSEARDDGAGGRFYVCCDCEGHLWSIGTRMYGAQPPPRYRRPSLVLPTLSALMGMTAVLMTGGWIAYQLDPEVVQRTTDAVLAIWEETAAIQSLRKPVVSAHEASQRQHEEKNQWSQQERAAHAEQVRALQYAITKAVRESGNFERIAGELRSKLASAEEILKDRAASLALEQARMRILQDQLRTLQDNATKEAAARGELRDTVGDLRTKLSAAEQDAKDAAVVLDLERARVEVAEEKLHALQSKLERPEEAPAVRQADKAAPAQTVCTLAAQGMVRSHHDGPRLWSAADLRRLCDGAESSSEPIRCYDQLMSGQVAWGGGTVWKPDNALSLCGGTLRASQTIACFRDNIALGHGWRDATQRCHRLGRTAGRLGR